jgi:PHS family inorganic phosphate transporter-like MFS transporter
MMAAVFLMQPLGQLLAYVVGLAVLLTIGRSEGLDTQTDPVAAATTVDRIWRYVIGVGAIPALVAILFRLTIPESPRYTLDVDHDGARALKDTQDYLRIGSGSKAGGSSRMLEANGSNDVECDAADACSDGPFLRQPPKTASAPQTFPQAVGRESMEIINIGEGEAVDDNDEEEDDDDDEKAELPDPFSRSELIDFFIKQGNIKYLMGTAFCWFLLDFAFFGLGINNPRVIAQIWSSQPVANATLASTSPIWQNPTDGNLSIYETLRQDGIRSIITISVGSLLGSLIIIKLIDYVPRKAWLVWSFVGIAVLFAVAGGSYTVAANSDLHALTIVFYVLCQLLFNLGESLQTCLDYYVSTTPLIRLLRAKHPYFHGKYLLSTNKLFFLPLHIHVANNTLDPCRDLSNSLSRHLPRYLRCLRQTRQYNSASLPPFYPTQQPQLNLSSLGPHRLLFRHGPWRTLCLGLDP